MVKKTVQHSNVRIISYIEYNTKKILSHFHRHAKFYNLDAAWRKM